MARGFLPPSATDYPIAEVSRGTFVESDAQALTAIGRMMTVRRAQTEARVPSPTSRAYTFYAALYGRAFAQDDSGAGQAQGVTTGRDYQQRQARATFRGLCAVFALREALGLDVRLERVALAGDAAAPALSRALVAALSAAPGGTDFWQTMRMFTVRSTYGGPTEVLAGLSPLTGVFPAARPPANALGGLYWYVPPQPRREGHADSYREPVWHDPTSSALADEGDEFLLDPTTRSVVRGALRLWTEQAAASLAAAPPVGIGMTTDDYGLLRAEVELWRAELQGYSVPAGVEVAPVAFGMANADDPVPPFLTLALRGVPGQLLGDLALHGGRVVVTADGLTSRTRRIWGRRYGDARWAEALGGLKDYGDNLGDALGLGLDAAPVPYVSVDKLFTPRLTLLTRDQETSPEWLALRVDGGQAQALFPFVPGILPLLASGALAGTADVPEWTVDELVRRTTARQSQDGNFYIVSLDLGGERVERHYATQGETGYVQDPLVAPDTIDLRLFPNFDLSKVRDRLPVKADGTRPDETYFARLRLGPGWTFKVRPFRLEGAQVVEAFTSAFPGAESRPGSDTFSEPPGSLPPGHTWIARMSARPDGFSLEDRGLCFVRLPEPTAKGVRETSWDIGVDFGTSNTCVAYRAAGGQPATLDLPVLTTTLFAQPQYNTVLANENASGGIVSTNEGASAAFDFFYKLNRDDVRLNDQTYYPTQILTRQSNLGKAPGVDGPAFDLDAGLIHFRNANLTGALLLDLLREIPSGGASDRSPSKRFTLYQDIKWEHNEWLRQFMGHLRKHVVLAAAKQNASVSSLSFSYPRAFTSAEYINFRAGVKSAWEMSGGSAASSGDGEAGVAATPVELTFRTESEAVRKTLAAGANQRVVFDVGGGTTDLIGFHGPDPVFQSSLKMAAKLINQYVVASAPLREAFGRTVNAALGGGLDTTLGSLLGSGNETLTLNAWLGLLQTIEIQDPSGQKLDEVVVNLCKVGNDEGAEGDAVRGFFLSTALLFGGLAFYGGRLHRAATTGRFAPSGVEAFPLQQVTLTLTGNGSKLHRLLSPKDYSFNPVFEDLFRRGLSDDGLRPNVQAEGIFRQGNALAPKATVALGLLAGGGGVERPLPVADLLGEVLPGYEGGVEAPAGEFYARAAKDARTLTLPDHAPPELAAFLDAFHTALPRGQNGRHTVVPGLGDKWNEWLKGAVYDRARPEVLNRIQATVRELGREAEVVEAGPQPNRDFPSLEPLFIAELAALLTQIRADHADTRSR